MVLKSTFEGRGWKEYPLYLPDKKHDNLDDEPHEPRNTTKTLAEELTACGEDPSCLEGFSDSKTTKPMMDHIPSDPNRRPKAHMGKRFLKALSAHSQVEQKTT